VEAGALNIMLIMIVCIITTAIFFYQVATATNKSSYQYGFKAGFDDYHCAIEVPDCDQTNNDDVV
jgi:hypothetical protein